MRNIITIEKKYINIPIDNDAPAVHVTIKNPETQDMLRYFDINFSGEQKDLIVYYDMAEFIGQEVEIEIADDNFARKFLAQFKQSDKPMGLEDVYKEKHRPQFHFSSKRGWLNDPNGLVYYGGKYHMFYQHNPFGRDWGNIHWGHATSEDLIHWQEKDDVLCPDETGLMFSGGGVVDWNNSSGLQINELPPILLFYTAAGEFAPAPCDYTVGMAYSVDGGETFNKYACNPVVGCLSQEARDPKVIWHEESHKWGMVLFNGDHAKTFIFLTSANLLDWQISQEIAIPDGRECPEFFPIPLDDHEDNTKWILMEANGRYFIGTFDGEKFVPEAGPFNSFGRYGEGCCYAGQIWSNAPDERKIMICWQTGECQPVEFSHNMTIPVELSLKSFSDGMRLCAEPIKELENIREASWKFTDVQIESAGKTPDEFLKVPKGNTWDIEFELGMDCDLIVNICGEDIALDAKLREVRMAAAKFFFPDEVEVLKIRVLVDSASIEVFGGDGRIWYAKRKLTTLSHPVIFPYQTSGSGSLKKVTIHKMESAWSK